MQDLVEICIKVLLIKYCNCGSLLSIEAEFCTDDGFSKMMKTAPLLSAQCHHPFWAASDVTGYFSSFVRVQNLYGSYRCSLIETKKAKSNSLLIRKQYRLNAVQRACSAWRNPTNEHYDPPKYPLGVKLLYCVYFCACLMERTWRFALPLVLANLEGMVILDPHMQ